MVYENPQLLDNKIGVLVKIINVYYGNTKGDRFVVLVKAMKRFKILDKLRSNYMFSFARVEDYEDEDATDPTLKEQDKYEIIRTAVQLVDSFAKRFGARSRC